MPQTLELADRLLSDEPDVLEDVLRELGPVVSAVMRRRYEDVLRAADVEDLVAIGLYRLWANRKRFDPERGSLRVWFFRIVDNAARDVLRHGWHRARRLEVTGDALIGVADPRRNGHSVPETPPNQPTALQMEVREIIAELPESQRHIVMADAAAKDDIASSQWLADDLKITASTVRVYRKRAMDRIRNELRERGHDVP